MAEEENKEQENGAETKEKALSPEELEAVQADEDAISKEYNEMMGIEPPKEETDTSDTEDEEKPDEDLPDKGDTEAKAKSEDDAGEEEPEEKEVETGDEEEPDPDADKEEPVEDDPTVAWIENKIDFKAHGEDKTRTFKVGKDGKLSPQSEAELKKTLALAEGIQYKYNEAKKELDQVRETSQSELDSERRNHGEYVRSNEVRIAADKPIQHLLDAIRKEPFMRQLLEGQKDDNIRTILKKHGWDGSSQTSDYDATTEMDRQEVRQQKYSLFKMQCDKDIDAQVNAYAEEAGLNQKQVDRIVTWGQKNMEGSFAWRTDQNGELLSPEKQAEHFIEVIKSAHGRMVIAGELKTKDHLTKEEKLDKEEKLKKRNLERQRNKNRRSKAATSAPGKSSAGVDDADRPLEGESFHDFAKRDPEIQKAFEEM